MVSRGILCTMVHRRSRGGDGGAVGAKFSMRNLEGNFVSAPHSTSSAPPGRARVKKGRQLF